MKKIAITSKIIKILIETYRTFLSPVLHGLGFFVQNPGCRFYPSCSVYAEQAVEKYGATKGAELALKRLLKCHPFNKGGADPLK